MKDEFLVYSDGASRKDRRGGWGFCIWYDGQWWDECGGAFDTTNNRMELLGAISAIEFIDGVVTPERAHIEIWVDSEYVRMGATEYLEDWKRRGWRTSSNQPVKNQDLWERLENAARKHLVDWRWLKGHRGDEGNERADRLATKGVPAKEASPDQGEGEGPSNARTARLPVRRRSH